MSLASVHDIARRLFNPAWEFIRKVPHSQYESPEQFVPEIFSMSALRSGGSDLVAYRDQVTTRWTWAIPAPETLAFIVETLDGRPVVEIGAGTGYWAWMLDQMGIDINAYDVAPVGHPDSWFSEEKIKARLPDSSIEPEEFYPVWPGGPEMLAAEDPDRVLLLIWPTMDSFAYESVKQFKGDTIIYIGESSGGCTADDQFFMAVGEGCGCWFDHEHDMIEALFEYADTGPMTHWWGIHDRVVVYKRKES